MTAEEFITLAIETGARDGLAALDETQRWVYLVSEAEVLCDMGPGLEGFIEAYGPEGLLQAADGFAAIGAGEIAERLRGLATAPEDKGLTEQADAVVAARTGYDYEAIRAAVERRLAQPEPTQEHLALRTPLDLYACCAVVQAALGTGPFRFESENETEWGEALGADGTTINVSRPYQEATLQQWDPSVPEGCNVGVTVWSGTTLDVATLAQTLAEALGVPVHHHRTWHRPGENTTFDRVFLPAMARDRMQ